MIIGSNYRSHTRIGSDRFTVVMRLVDSPVQVPAREVTITVFGSSNSELSAAITREIAAIKAKESTEDLLVALPIDFPFAVDLPADPTPTAYEIWLKAARKWQFVKSLLIDTGIKTGSETEIVALKMAATSGYSAAYLDNF